MSILQLQLTTDNENQKIEYNDTDNMDQAKMGDQQLSNISTLVTEPEDVTNNTVKCLLLM